MNGLSHLRPNRANIKSPKTKWPQLDFFPRLTTVNRMSGPILPDFSFLQTTSGKTYW
jgi:hypothetical protein